jgi:hypothetical protein
MSKMKLASTLRSGGLTNAAPLVVPGTLLAAARRQQQPISPTQGISFPDPTSLSGLPPQGIILALMMLNQLEVSLGKEFDDKMKLLSRIGHAIKQARDQAINLAKQSFTAYSSSLFNLPVSEDDVPSEGAMYSVGKKVFPGDDDSRVSAMLRIQWIASIDPAKILGVPQDMFGGAELKTMVPGGFVYLLQKDSAGFISQVPVVPKIEIGVGLEGESEAMKLLKGEIKTETEFETTFFWLKNPPMGGYRFLSVIINLFNQVMSSEGNGVSIGLQSCERGGTAVDPSGTNPSRNNPVPVAGQRGGTS